MGAAGVTVFEDYTKLFNFTRPISVQKYSLLFSRPKELSRLYLFTAPFSTDASIRNGFLLNTSFPFGLIISDMGLLDNNCNSHWSITVWCQLYYAI